MHDRRARPSSPALAHGRRARRGATLVLIAIFIVVLIGFLGLSLDYAFLRKSTQELQASADSAALAAAQVVTDDDQGPDFEKTRQTAAALAAANEVANASVLLEPNSTNAPEGDIVVGRWDRITQTFTPTTNGPDAVQVTARRTASSLGGSLILHFGQFSGVFSSEIARSAIARLGANTGSAVLILHPSLSGALELRGNATLTVPYDRIQVNSNHARAFRMAGAPNVPRVWARGVDVVGNYQIPENACYPEPTPSADPLPDPLADLPYPDPSTMDDYGSITEGGSYQPGYYPGGVDFNGGTAELAAGVYYFGPPGIRLHGSAQLVGQEVMLFIGPEVDCQLVIAGNSPGLDISSPVSGTFQGVSVFQHRANFADCDISGGGLFAVRGTMYLAGAHLEMDGNVDRTVGRIIVSSQLLRGTASYTITGIDLPGDGQPKSFLVH